MPVKSFSLSEPPRSPGFGIYGPNGVGKTSLLRTIPGRGVYIDTSVLEEGGFVIGDVADRVHAVRCEEWEDLEDIFWALKKRDAAQIPGIDEKDARGRYKTYWFAFDSVSGAHVLATRKIIKERDRSLGEDPHKITLQERGWISQLEAEMIFRLRSLDEFWQFYIAQERLHSPFEESDPSPTQIGPDLPAGALKAFKQSLTILGRMGLVTDDKGKEVRQLRVGPSDGDYIVKARTTPGRCLPNLIANPDLGVILRYLFDPRSPHDYREAGIKRVRESTGF